MKINVAGAGAGKTTKMADKIIDKYNHVSDFQNIYCITFTNNATTCIEKKLVNYFGQIPSNIKVSTIHSFLYREFIKPYYYLLYQKQFDDISNIMLENNPRFSKWKMNQLEEQGILHINAFTEKAKWIVVKKSNDKKREKEIRKIILKTFSCYCAMIFLDEAQDIDSHLVEILKQLNLSGIEIELMGDPKQDLKGFGSLRQIMFDYSENIIYLNTCHRCPQNHLDMSNSIIQTTEWQTSEKKYGDLSFVFESDIDVSSYNEQQKFDLLYISKKNDRYDTHSNLNETLQFDSLHFALKERISELYSNKEELVIRKVAYYYTNKLINIYHESLDSKKAMKAIKVFNDGNKKAYAKIISALEIVNIHCVEKICVNSIDAIKGQEGKSCLFVLTTDLAAYLFKEKVDDNKTKNRLYVALTRSLDKLTILITNEVENKYNRDYITNYLRPFVKY